VVDGGGNPKFLQVCEHLLNLEYSVFLLHDTDKLPDAEALTRIKNNGGAIEGWQGNCSTEERIFLDVPWKTVCELVDYAKQCKGPDSVLASIHNAAKVCASVSISSLDYSTWNDSLGIRQVLGRAAKGSEKEKTAWFKDITRGECVGSIIGPCLEHFRK
jgi:hypothetical protein